MCKLTLALDLVNLIGVKRLYKRVVGKRQVDFFIAIVRATLSLVSSSKTKQKLFNADFIFQSRSLGKVNMVTPI